MIFSQTFFPDFSGKEEPMGCNPPAFSLRNTWHNIYHSSCWAAAVKPPGQLSAHFYTLKGHYGSSSPLSISSAGTSLEIYQSFLPPFTASLTSTSIYVSPVEHILKISFLLVQFEMICLNCFFLYLKRLF